MTSRFKMKAAFLAASAVTLMGVGQVHAALSVTFTSYSNTLVTSNGARNAGFAFTVGAAGTTISSLDYYLNSGTSGQASTIIRLYTSSGAYGVTGTTSSVFSDTVTTSIGSTTPQGGTISTATLTATPTAITYYIDNLAVPLTLGAGTYYLSGDGANNAIVPYLNGGTGTNGFAIDPSLTFVGPLYASGNSTPTSNSGAIPTGYTGGFNVNLGVVAAAVPEPASLGAIAVGAGVLLGRRYRRVV